MKLLHYSQSYPSLSHSLIRYFKYIFNLELKIITYFELLHSDDFLLIHAEHKTEPEFLKLYCNGNLKLKIIVLGFDSNASVNLSELSQMNERFKLLLYQDVHSDVFSKEEVLEKLQIFFKTHGKESVFQALNGARYHTRNGIVQFLQEQLEYDDYYNHFLIPARDYWQTFNERYEKFRPYIILSPHREFAVKIDEHIKTIDPFIESLFELGFDDLFKKGGKYFPEHIGLLKNLDDILLNFYNELGLGEKPVQNTPG